ncbi:hypothetical protein acdb102_17590 [Acidothermaceae bacterium B102]|nr:hypothetical protein acdb102_17590 [Acidothermaceae bacterium B102]
MQYSSLLAQLVSTRSLAPEPVATDALVHILQGSPRASSAMATLVSELANDARFEELHFSGQVLSTEDAGRPDIVGTGDMGVRVVIEAKFDAELTTAQLGTSYLYRLPPHQPGVLMYLVPANRMPAVWPTLMRGPAQVGNIIPPDLTHRDLPYLRHDAGNGRVIAAVSWSHLLSRLESALTDASDSDARSDLRQLQGLVDWRTREGWIPVVAGDLNGRIAQQLVGLRDAVLQAAGVVTSKPTNGSGDSGPGRRIKTAGGRIAWVGVWFPGWARFDQGPVWATVTASGAAASQALRVAFEPLAGEGGPGVYPVGAGWAVPLRFEFGAEQGAIAQSFADQIGEFVRLLDLSDAATSVGELSAEPAEDALAPDDSERDA